MHVYIGNIYIYAIYTQLYPYIYAPALIPFTYTNQPMFKHIRPVKP